MKSKLLSMVLGLVIFSFSTSILAEVRIAAVNINKVLRDAPQAKTTSSNMQGKFSSREKTLLAEQEEIRKMEDKYLKDKDVLSETEKSKRENEMRTRLREYKRKTDDFSEDFSLARNKALSSLQSDVYKAIVTVSERENYDLVVSESVLYASDRIDITDKVLEELNRLAD